MIMESGGTPTDDLQVQFVDIPVPATTIQVRIDGELAGEALVLTHTPGTCLLVSMSWHRGPHVTDVDDHRRRTYGALLLAAADLAERHGATLVSVVGTAEEANHLTCRAHDRPVPDPWVVVTFGSSADCGLSACPVGVDGPYPGREAAKAAGERLSFMNPHLLPLTGPPVLPLSGAGAPDKS
jgi:hypothetical protein